MNRLQLDKENKKLAGVFSGLGNYFSLDPVILRLIFIFLCLFNPILVLFYPLAVMIMPRKSDSEQQSIKIERQEEEEK